MSKTYTQQEKKAILKELDIAPLNGMVNSNQAAKIMSKRAEIETGERHSYGDDAVRWRIKSGKLNVALSMNKRLNLFNIDDIFALDLEPHKWHSHRNKDKNKKKPEIDSITS